MLTEDEIDGMRADFEQSLPDTANILRKTGTDDGQGGTADEDWDIVGTVPCRLSPVPVSRVMESESAGRIMADLPRTITMPAGTDVEMEDRIEVISADWPETSHTFEVTGALDPRTYQLGTRVLVTEVI